MLVGQTSQVYSGRRPARERMLRAPCPCGVPELAAVAAGGGEGDLGSVPRGPRRVHIKGKAPHGSKDPVSRLRKG